MGPIIPPSIPFIIYGVTANVSIGALFIGGVFPGLLLGAALMVYMYFLAVKRNYPLDKKAPLKGCPHRRREGASRPVHAGPDPGRHPERHVHAHRGGRRRVRLFDLCRELSSTGD